MTYEDILIAQVALKDSKIPIALNSKELICDIYAIPSHNHQTFYTQIYRDGTDYIFAFTKSYVATPIGLKSAMSSFKESLKADDHIAYKGDIYCGMKRVSADDPIIKALLDCLPQKDELIETDSIMLDGVITFLRNYKHNKIITLGYHDSNDITINQFTQEQKEFLNELYIHIERIIGNLIVSNTNLPN